MATLSRDFGSDNVTPVCAPIMRAIEAANTGSVGSYGADEYTERLHSAARELFETDLVIYPVATGTAANALALAQIASPYGGIYCHETAHIVTDECGAPEFFTGGAKLLGLPSPNGKVDPRRLEAAIALANEMGVHHVKPAALSVTQSTEWGTVYDLEELSELTAIARSHRLPVHMDGARFANALAHLGCSPAAATWKSGVDVLSLGASKNGAMCAEAVVFFKPALAEDFERRRKQAGHLWSKFRYLSCQLLAYLEEDLWLRNARQANAMAARLAQGLIDIAGVRLMQRVQANEIFLVMPKPLVDSLEQAGFHFYGWPWRAVSDGVPIRLVTSYATTPEDVEDFIRTAHQLVASAREGQHSHDRGR
jgi:threonine aldolase